MAALRELFDDGLVRMVGISNASVPQIDSARAVLGDALVSVQNQFSPATGPRRSSWRTARSTDWRGCPGARSAECRRRARSTPRRPRSPRSPPSSASRSTR
ncbi:aldo/keto reductase [Blastococcus brunescens]|uniref:Aldo/keto reductase n=1 Tax=Blastococcus brunescens TaxID=1564165 RepID=A0ABZ1B934_9ACTN|nr:aldo/keto reductase [Blastococcus sp. BMG 8361]WRL66196.1 aldo/keto reductase [Blastococcus sp. BMG 8361]